MTIRRRRATMFLRRWSWSRRSRMETQNSQSKARLIVMSVFVIGFAAGAVALNLYQSLNGSNKKDPRRGGTEFLIGKMNEEVGLTSDQQDKIRKILDETSDKYKQIRVEIDPVVKQFEPR